MVDHPHPNSVRVLKILANLSGDVVPSIRGLAKEAGFASAQSIQRHLDALEEVGYIERDEAPSRKRRPIRLTKQGWDAAGEMPFAGRIAAGRGLEALAVGESYSLTAGLLGSESGKSRYLLRVVGESMRDAGIHDGDLLVVEEDPSPEDGAIVVALLDGGEEVTVKRLRRENGHIRLRAQSAGHEDIVIAAEEVEIQGRVVWTLHPS
ncbi:MAG: transcriptional repressor LexA [Rubrobacteraceae bacterium]